MDCATPTSVIGGGEVAAQQPVPDGRLDGAGAVAEQERGRDKQGREEREQPPAVIERPEPELSPRFFLITSASVCSLSSSSIDAHWVSGSLL